MRQRLDFVHGETDQPAIDYDDRMCGHVLTGDFMERRQLRWNRRSDDLAGRAPGVDTCHRDIVHDHRIAANS